MSVQITERVVNDNNNRSCKVKLAGTPSGTVSFYVRPGVYSGDGAEGYWWQDPADGNDTWHVAVNLEPHKDTTGLWWVRGKDDAGYTDWMPVWIGLSSSVLELEAVEKIRDILRDNQKAIEWMMNQWNFAVTVKSVEAEMRETVQKTPSIEVIFTGLSIYQGDPFFETQYGVVYQAGAEVYCYVTHQDPVNQTRLMKLFAATVRNILNQNIYTDITLPCGLKLQRAFVYSTEYGFTMGEQGARVDMATLDWRALVHLSHVIGKTEK